MDWTQALEIVVARTGVERYRELCEGDSEQAGKYRALMIRLAYPPLIEQAGNAARAAAGFVASGFALADEAEQSRRLAICGGCEFFASDANRCAKCGCGLSLKARLASSSCPTGRW